jgi:cell division protein FtsL
MRKRNRKKTAHGFASPVPFAGLVVLAVVTALSYVWLEYCYDSLGSELKSLEKQKDGLNQKYLNDEYKWMQEKSPRGILAALKKHNLPMTWPTSSQVVHLQAPAFDEHVFASLDAELMEAPRLGRVVMND